jgi:hypothetical protein
MIDLRTTPKSLPQTDPLVKHLDEWQQLSERKREDALGKNFYEDTKNFFCMADNIISPRFRPAVNIPELQILCMREANDLSEFQPTVYIYSQTQEQRVESIEQGFHAAWNDANVPYHLLFANIWSQFAGTGFIQWGLDPYARNGKGRMWVASRDPRTVHCDPATDYKLDWSWVILEDYMHLEEIKAKFPERARFLPRYPTNSTKDIRGEQAQTGFRLPDGPFQSMPPFNNVSTRTGLTSRIRRVFCKDYTRQMVGPPPREGADPVMAWKYPGGRMIVEAEGVILADGPNPFPHGRFSIAPIWATPPLYGIWAVPPTRYTSQLQNLAERTYSQTFENFYRLNNGVWFIPENSGIKQSDFGGVPGEKHIYHGDKPPSFVAPAAFPESSIKFPQTLLQHQRDLQGFSGSRQGDAGQGNVSVDLFDASVLRSQGLTQLRGRLASQGILELGSGMAYTMMDLLPSQVMPYKGADGAFGTVKWTKPDSIDDHEMFLDVGAFHAQSQVIVRRIAEQLAAKGVIGVGEFLTMIGYPGAERIGKEAEEKQALAALANAGSTPGRKK